MKYIKAILITLMSLSPLLFSAVCPAAGELAKISQAGVLRVGYVPSPPGTMKDPVTGELTGFYIDAIKTITADMGVKPVFVETTWANFVAGLQSNQFDVSIASTFANVKRAMAVDFTAPIFYLGSVAVVKAGDQRFSTLKDMDTPDVKVAVIQGTAAETYVKNNLPNAKVTSLGTGNLTAGFMEVAAGRADVSFEDQFTANRFAAQQPSVKVLFNDKPVNFLPIAWTVNKGNTELLSVLNVGMNNLLVSGAWDATVAKYIKGGRFVDQPNLREFPRIDQ